jgi:predicted enzyme related to lactoylglutathione lyase
MTAAFQLAAAEHVAFIPINDKDKALTFYRDLLGLTFIEDQSPFALLFELNGHPFRITFVGEFKPQQFTILGWRVPDIATAVRELEAAGLAFNHYPWLGENTTGIWTTPGGTQIAWFSDPFGNVLSLQQDPPAA